MSKRGGDWKAAGEAFRQALEKQTGLPLNEIAKEVGVSDATIGNWLAGRTVPTSENMKKLDAVMGWGENYLRSVAYGEPRPPRPGVEDRVRALEDAFVALADHIRKNRP